MQRIGFSAFKKCPEAFEVSFFFFLNPKFLTTFIVKQKKCAESAITELGQLNYFVLRSSRKVYQRFGFDKCIH